MAKRQRRHGLGEREAIDFHRTSGGDFRKHTIAAYPKNYRPIDPAPELEPSFVIAVVALRVIVIGVQLVTRRKGGCRRIAG